MCVCVCVCLCVCLCVCARVHARLMESAKEIIRESLPIKCLEAVVVALYLTSPLTSVHRTALSFKSKQGDLYFRSVSISNRCHGMG